MWRMHIPFNTRVKEKLQKFLRFQKGMNRTCYTTNKTGLQPVSRPVERVPLLWGLEVGALYWKTDSNLSPNPSHRTVYHSYMLWKKNRRIRKIQNILNFKYFKYISSPNLEKRSQTKILLFKPSVMQPMI